MRFLKVIFVDSTKSVYIQFLRYGFAASVSLAIDFGLLIILKEYAYAHYLLAATISFIAGLLTNYFLSNLWVFNSSKLSSKRREFLIFTIIGLIGLGLTDLLLWILTSIIGLYYVLSKSIATVIVYFWNFGARKKILFN